MYGTSAQHLCMGLPLHGLYKMSDAVIRALGAVYRSSWRAFVYACLVIGGATISVRFGLEAVALSVVVGTCAKYLMVGRLALKLIGGSWPALFRCQMGGVLSGGVAGLVLALGRVVLGYGTLEVNGSVAVAALTAGLICWLIRRKNSALNEGDLVAMFALVWTSVPGKRKTG